MQSVIRTLFFMLILTVAAMPAEAQCNSGCTYTVSTNSSSISVNSGETVCLTYAGTFTQSISVASGGTLCIGPTTTVSSSVTLGNGNGSGTINLYGKFTGGYTSNSNTTSLTVYSGGVFAPSSISLNGGTITNNVGGTITLSSAPQFNSGVVFNSYGTLTTPGFTLNSGSTVSLSGTLNITGTATNNSGALTISGPNTTISGSLTLNGSSNTTLSGGVTVTGSMTVNSTVQLSGSLTVGGTLTNNGAGTITASGSATVTAGSINNYGAISGGGNCFPISPATSGTLTNGAMSPSITGTTSGCGSVSLTASGGSSYSWSGGSTPSTAANTFTSSGTYTVSVTSAGCTVTASQAVTVTATPAAAISGTASGCVSVTLTATGGTSYHWSGGSSTNTATNTFTSNGTTYTVTVTSGTCTATASKTVTVSANPTAGITTTSSVCGLVTLTASGGGTYSWSGGSSPGTAVNTFTSSNTYTVTVTSASGCTAASSKAITVTATPTAGITGSASGCVSVSLTATGGTTYHWSGGSSINTAANTFSSNGTYTVTVTASGCTATASQTVTVNANPTAGITGTATNCGSVSLTATGGTSYAWSGGSSTNTATNTFTTGGTYTVTVTSGGCTATSSKLVTVNSLPSATIANNGPICAGTSLTVTATPVSGGPLTYSWSGPASYTSSSASFTISSAATTAGGTYTVTITGSNSCTATVSTAVSVISCVSVSGAIFDDANGDGTVNTGEAKTNLGNTLYSVIADSNGHVVTSSIIASDGSFSLSNIWPSESGLTVRISTTQPTVGSTVSAASWPSNWTGTLGQYGTNNAAGTGVYNNSSELIPVTTTTTNITNLYIGFDRYQAPVTQSFSILRPHLNSIETLDSAAGFANITWTDPEDGINKGSFIVLSVAAMNGNVLFYDNNSNNSVDAGESINGYTVINNFNNQKLKMKLSAAGTLSAGFSFTYMDAASKTNPTPSTYKVQWSNGALPVKLVYFTADKGASNVASLKWATASELDNAYFEVERSADGLNWDKLVQVTGAGTTTQEELYSYTDDTPLTGVNYYRLKQVDVDGNFVYTNIAQVTFDAAASAPAATMTMYPNPLSASAPLTIELSNAQSTISNVTITNAVGQVVYSQVSSSDSVLHLSGLELAAGVYAVSVFTDGSKPLTSLLSIK